MTSPIGMAEYFAMEAGDYLDRLHALVTSEAAPPPEDLVRFCRALRGSALMANQPHVARAASGLEALAKGYREGRSAWDADLRGTLEHAVDELRQLVRRAGSWGEEEAARADRLARALEGRAGIPSPAGPRISPPGGAGVALADSEAGIRAFVAREGALAAAALDRAARALRTTPGARDPLYAVLRRLQSLRGLAAMNELSPLPELLEAIEQAVGEMTRMFAPPPDVAEVFDAAAQALSRGAQDVARSGRPASDAEEPARFAALLLQVFAAERDVVDIASLFPAGGDGVVQAGVPPQQSPQAQLGTVELVSMGEHLTRAAADLEHAPTSTVRQLRLYTTVTTLGSLAHAAGTLVPEALRDFADRARHHITTTAGRDAQALAAVLREAGTTLRDGALAGAPADQAVFARLLDRLEAGEAGVDEIVPIETLEMVGESRGREVEESRGREVEESSGREVEDDREVVPIEALEYTEPVMEAGGIAGSFLTRDRLRRERPAGPASLEALLGGSGAAPAAVPAPTFEAAAVMDIDDLCYSGEAALRRAREVSHDLARLFGETDDPRRVRPLVAELQDLMALAHEPSGGA